VPRGKSAAGKGYAGWGRVIVVVCAHIRCFGALMGHYGALIAHHGVLPNLWLRQRLRRRRTQQTPNLSRKRLLSQAC